MLIEIESRKETVLFEQKTEVAFPLVDLEWDHRGENIAIVITGRDAQGFRLDTLGLLSINAATLTPLMEGASESIGSPSWFPGDEWLAAITWGSGEGTIVNLNSEGDCLLRLLPGNITALEIDTSPDGTKLAIIHLGMLYTLDLTEAIGPQFQAETLACLEE